MHTTACPTRKRIDANVLVPPVVALKVTGAGATKFVFGFAARVTLSDGVAATP